MISTNQFKSGMTVLLDGQIYAIVSFQHVKPGKGGAFVRTKLKNFKVGNIIDKTFRSGEKLEQAFVYEKKMQFLYRQGNSYHLMDEETFEELEISSNRLGEKTKFLKENTVLSLIMHEKEIIDINLPTFIELKIDHTEPGMRADTVKNVMKAAILETGGKVFVPLFVNKGDTIKIDTRSGTYVTRV